MAEYNAGSIEGTLDINTDPFVAGLELAKAQAEKFENEDYTATVRINRVGGDADDADRIGGDSDATLDLNTLMFDEALIRARAELAALDRAKAEPKVDLDTSPMARQLRQLRDEMDDVNGKGTDSKGGGGFGLKALIGGVIALTAALGPAGSAVGLYASAVVAGFGRAAISLGLYAGVAGGIIGDLKKAMDEGVMLPGMAGKAQVAIAKLSGAWKGLQDAVAPGVYKNVINATGELVDFLPKLAPLLANTATGLDKVIDRFGQVFDGPAMANFLKVSETNALENLPVLGNILANITEGILGLFVAFDPVIDDMLRGIEDITASFSEWANSEGIQFVKDWWDQVRQYGPEVKSMFAGVGDTLMALFEGLAPLTGPAISFFDTLFTTLGKLDLKPLGEGFGALLTALEPLIPVIGEFANSYLIPFLGDLLELIAMLISIPGVGPALLALAGGIAAVKTASNIATGVSDFFGSMSDGFKAMDNIATVILRLFGFATAETAVGAGGAAAATGTSAFAGALRILSAVLLTGGVLLAIAAIGLAVYLVIKHWDKIKGWFGDLWEWLKDFFADVGDWFVDAGKWLVDGIVKGLKWAWDHTLYGFLWNRKDKIIGFFAKAGDWLKDAGGDVIRGLLSGFKWAWDNLIMPWWNATGGLLVKVFRAVMDMHSPSRIMSGLGRNTIAGLGDGMVAEWDEKIAPWLHKAGSELGQAFNDISATLGGGTLTLNKTPLQTAVDALTAQVASAQGSQASLADALVSHADAVGEALSTQNDEHAKMVTEAFESASEKSTQTVIAVVRKK